MTAYFTDDPLTDDPPEPHCRHRLFDRGGRWRRVVVHDLAFSGADTHRPHRKSWHRVSDDASPYVVYAPHRTSAARLRAALLGMKTARAGMQGSPAGAKTDRGPDKHGPGSLSVDTGLLRARLAAIVARADGGLRLDTCSFQVEPDGSIRWFELAVDVGRPHPMVLAGGPIRRIEDAEDMVRAAVVDRRGGPHA